MAKIGFDFEEGYSYGWENGRMAGNMEGFSAAVEEYEMRMKALWTEIQTLNARIDRITTLIDQITFKE